MAVRRPWRPVAVGMVGLAAALVGIGFGSLAGPGPVVAGIVGYLLAAVLVLAHRSGSRLGVANVVTLTRVVGTCTVGVLTVESVVGERTPAAQLVMVGLAVGCLLLDGVDGRVARSRGEVSDFGARFDMETDAALLAVLSIAVVAFGVAGPWALLIGGLRYLYVLAGLVVPALHRPLRASLARKVVAVVQGVALCVALLVDALAGPAGADGWPALVLAGALALLVWSFGRDIVWQLRQGRTVRRG